MLCPAEVTAMGLEPYARTTLGGRTLNRRTAAAVTQWQTIYTLLEGRGTLHITQGSYNKDGVKASAGTHDGGGAVDVTATDWEICEYAGRLVGFAAWHRLPSEGPWVEHCHGILVGDKEMSAGAAKQIHDYYAGLNALATHRRDTSPRPTVILSFAYPLRKVNFNNLREQALKNDRAIHAVKVVQRTLNAKTGSQLLVDGRYGSVTKGVYRRWEKQVDGVGDGLPSEYALTLLGAARFNVT